MLFLGFVLIIAVDGPSGAGKGTIAAYLASLYNLKHLDTGLLYRATAFLAIEKNVSFDEEAALSSIASSIDLEALNDPRLRHESTANAASKVAVFPAVRNILTHQMHLFCQNILPPYVGAILDGRDIGTFVYPNADLKFFVTAEAGIRATRRHKEMKEQNQKIEGAVLEKLTERDARDSNRASAPLCPAPGAYIIDTTDLTAHDACQVASQVVERYLNAKKTQLEG